VKDGVLIDEIETAVLYEMLRCVPLYDGSIPMRKWLVVVFARAIKREFELRLPRNDKRVVAKKAIIAEEVGEPYRPRFVNPETATIRNDLIAKSFAAIKVNLNGNGNRAIRALILRHVQGYSFKELSSIFKKDRRTVLGWMDNGIKAARIGVEKTN
jgi:DNA-directed RNA polymerase specialized sigma24 family protein